MSLKTRVEGYVGSISDTTLLTDMLTASTKYVFDLLPANDLIAFTVNQTVATGGYGVQPYRVLSVSKSGYPARRIDATMKSMVSDYGSMYYATTTDPVYYVENGSIFILPAGGTIAVVAYPAVDGAQTFIYGLPQGLDEAVVILTSMKELMYKSNAYIDSLNSLTMDSVIAPTVPSAPSFTYTDAVLGSYISTIVGSFGAIPTYLTPSNSASFTNAGTYISTDEDLEKAQVELSKQSTLLNQYSTDIQNNLNRFNLEATVYQAGVSRASQDAQLAQARILQMASDTKDLNLQNEAQTLASQVQEYQSKVALYQMQVQTYMDEINYKVQKFSTRSSNINAQYAAMIQQITLLEKQLSLVLGKYLGGSK